MCPALPRPSLPIHMHSPPWKDNDMLEQKAFGSVSFGKHGAWTHRECGGVVPGGVVPDSVVPGTVERAVGRSVLL